MNNRCFYKYLEFDGEKFFTMVLLPETGDKFPVVVFRSPYVGNTVNKADEEILENVKKRHARLLERGYAVVDQHCRGQGKSSGAFVPYVREREDGLFLRQWIRKQPFYDGELFLVGASYTTSVHFATAPFEEDVKGAVFEVQDSERYRLWYRNGQMRKGHANWHFGLYKSKCDLKKSFDMKSFSNLPLQGLSERALGERAEDFEKMLFAHSPSHEFWKTRFGGIDAKDAATKANIPILFTTGYNDFYVGGMFSMWNALDKQTREKSALLVSPYNHGDGYDVERGVRFEKGARWERFGEYAIDWLDHIRKGTPLPYVKGVITYYRTFESRWESDFYQRPVREIALPLGAGVRSFLYDPKNPPAFEQEGIKLKEANNRTDVISVETTSFDKDVFVKGKMKAILSVSSDCPDTSFYVRVSIKKDGYTYVLRHDITSLCYQFGDYEKNAVVGLDFSFDEYAFLLKKGERLQVDISSTDDNTYVSHTNRKGEYALQTGADIAVNTVYLDKSYLILPIE